MAQPGKSSDGERERHLYLGTVLENVTDIVTILDAKGKLLYESPAMTAVLGYSIEERAGKNAFAYIHPDDYKRVFSVFLEAILQKNVVRKVEVRHRHKDGRWITLECVGKNLLFDPQVRGVVLCSRDITERLQTEAQTRLQAKALQAAYNGILITDAAGQILWVNEAFTRMTGYSAAEAFGRNPRILKSGEQSQDVYRHLWDTILAGKVWSGEIINRRKDGALYFEKTTITPVKGDDGKITHFIAVKDDVSADKKLESQFRQAQKMEVVGQLAGGVAHDFNNLLTVIIGQSEMLLAGIPSQSEEREPIQDILRMGRRAAGLTRQLLAFSRKQVIKLETTELNAVVRGADKMMRRLLGENIELVTLLSEKLDKVRVDTGQIEQAIMNLMVNARDAMPKGGKIVIETSRAAVDDAEAARRAGLQPGDYTVLSVSDTGCGMTSEVQAHIFEPFFTTKEKGRGTGLGLAMVYGIVKQCGGYIDVESAPGKGTTFKIYLPPALEAIVPEEEDAADRKLPTGRETILVAEDEELVRELVTHVLSRQGFKILQGKNGLEALRAADQHREGPVHLLITDMVMPFMGGSELVEKFHPRHPDTKILFTSGYVDHGVVQKWLDQGCRFLQKPYTPSELVHAVRDILDGVPEVVRPGVY